MKSILIEEELHKKLKEFSEKSGIKIKVLIEASIKCYLNKMKVDEREVKNGR